MLVVAVAMLGSLTVLPAVLSKLGDRVEKGRIPFVHGAAASEGDSRIWSAILDRVLRRPLISAVAAGGVLARAGRAGAQHAHRQTGHRRLPSPAVEPDLQRAARRLPRRRRRRPSSRSRPTTSTPPAVHAAIADLKREALATGQMNPPINVDYEPRRHRRQRRDPARRATASTTSSTAALETLRDDVLPAHGRQARRRRVRRHRLHRELDRTSTAR